MSKKIIMIFILVLVIAAAISACNGDSDPEVKQTEKPTAAITAEPTVAPTPAPTATPIYGANVAEGKSTEVSSTVDASYAQWGFAQEYVNDGSLELCFTSAVKQHMDSPDAEEWIIIDLEKNYSIKTVVLYPRFDSGYGFPENYQIDVSTDKSTWTTVYTKVGDLGAEDGDTDPRIIDFDVVSARYVKLLATKLTMVQGTNDGYLLQLGEFEVYGLSE